MEVNRRIFTVRIPIFARVFELYQVAHKFSAEVEIANNQLTNARKTQTCRMLYLKDFKYRFQRSF